MKREYHHVKSSCQVKYNHTSQSGLLRHKISWSDLIERLECKGAFVRKVHEILVGLGGCADCHSFCNPRAYQAINASTTPVVMTLTQL